MANNLQIQLSPNSFSRMQIDNEYRELLMDEALKRSNDSQDFVSIRNIVFKETLPSTGEETATSEGLELSSSSAGGNKEVWLEAPTKLLLTLYEEYRPKVGQTFALKNKGKMWNLIQKKLTEEGYVFSTSQVQGKYRSLERRFKNMKLNNSKTGRGRQSCPHESELERIMGHNKALKPSFFIDNHEPVKMDVENTDTSDNSRASPAVPGPSGLQRKGKPKVNTQDKILEKLDKIQESRTEYQKHKIQFNNKLLVVLQERNDVLKSIVEKFNN